MTTLVRSIRHWDSVSILSAGRAHRRVMPVLTLMAVVSVIPGGWTIATDALSEAYLAVAIFVAGTLALVFAAERAFKTDLGLWLDRHRRWQVPAAALLGAFPGCGGAIVAITQYTRGYLSFGAVVATLTTTMGDAMFLLLAREPGTAIGVLAASMAAGVVSGYLIDAVHGRGFMRPAAKAVAAPSHPDSRQMASQPLTHADHLWIVLMIPGVILSLLAAFQVEVDEAVAHWGGIAPAHWLGVIGAVLAVAMWIGQGREEEQCELEGPCSAQQQSLARSVIDTTNFVTSWVVFAFIGYELLLAVSGVDMGKALSIAGPLVPAAAILVGFIPGCGPQIMVTSLYLAGSIPLSAQLGNAIANDGDALFPAIAVAPKAAVAATLYSAIPAILVAYGWYGLME